MKLKIICFIIGLYTTLLSAEVTGTLEGRTSYYYPMSKTFRRIYNHGALFGLEGAVLITDNLYLYSGVNVLHTNGRSIGQRDRTELLLIPIELGLKYFLPIDLKRTDIYFGAGALPSYLWVRNDSPFVPRKRTKWGVGGVFKGGVMLYPSKPGFYIDLFINYYLLSMSFPNSSKAVGKRAILSGISTGAGIGYKF